jgi:hypothetical protein
MISRTPLNTGPRTAYLRYIRDWVTSPEDHWTFIPVAPLLYLFIQKLSKAVKTSRRTVSKSICQLHWVIDWQDATSDLQSAGNAHASPSDMSHHDIYMTGRTRDVAQPPTKLLDLVQNSRSLCRAQELNSS